MDRHGPVTGLVSAVWYDARNDSPTTSRSRSTGLRVRTAGPTWAYQRQDRRQRPSDNSVDNTLALSRELPRVHRPRDLRLHHDSGLVRPLSKWWKQLRLHDRSGLRNHGDLHPPDDSDTYTGPTSGEYHDPLTVSGTLFDTRRGTPIVGKTLTIGFGTDTLHRDVPNCRWHRASCTFTPEQVPGSYTATASFAGDIENSASTSAGVPFTLNKEQTNLVNLQPAFFGNGDTVTVSATLTEDDPTPVAGRSVTFTLGTGITAQTCTDPVTDAAGLATCQIVNVNQPQG